MAYRLISSKQKNKNKQKSPGHYKHNTGYRQKVYISQGLIWTIHR